MPDRTRVLAHTRYAAGPPRSDRPRPLQRPGAPGPPGSAARRHRFHRRHTPHFYLVVPGITAAAVVCALKLVAYLNRSVLLANISFIAVCVTALIIFCAFFWGYYMVMNGHIPSKRLKYLVPHAMVGMLSPLLYTLNISIDLDGLGSSPISGLSLACSVACLLLLGVQFGMGKLVVRQDKLHVVPRVPRN